MPSRRGFAALFLLVVRAAFGASGEAADGQLVLEDRIVAMVDDDPILLSELEQVIALGLVEPRPGEEDRAFHRRVLESLIEERLRFHEVDRFGFIQVPVGEIEAHVQEIRKRFSGTQPLEERLRETGLDEEGLRQIVARQLMVLRFVEERLGPRVFVGLEDIRAYYQDILVPEMERQGQAVPPLEEVREEIRNLLRERRLNEEIQRWTQELRREADVETYFDREPAALPPVILRIPQP